MKIAILNIYNGQIERGSEIFVNELSSRLFAHHDIDVFQSGEKKRVKYTVRQINHIPLLKNQGLYYDFWVIIFTLRCLVQIFRKKYDWIIPINGRWQIILCRLYRTFKKGKILISGHAGVGREDKFNILFGQPDIFIALSPLAFNWARQLTTNVKYIPNGVNTKLFNPKVIPIDLPLKSPIVLCNSALLSYKRIDLTIRAISLLTKVNLLIIGDGPEKLNLEILGKKILNNRFLIIPKVNYNEIPAFYRASQLFTLVSKESEAFGLVYLEAMACNIPVVAPDDKNRQEIIANAGLFCNPENIEDYAKKIQQALKMNWNYKPRKQAEKYSWDIISQKYEEVLEKYR